MIHNKINKIIKGFNYAIDGIIYSLKNETNMKIHFFAALVVLLTAIFFGVSRLEMVALVLTIILVIVLEMLNTAIERIVDMITIEKNESAKIVKDVSAGAVLVSALGSVFLAYLIFFDRFLKFTENGFFRIVNSKSHVSLLIIGILLILVIIGKTIFYRGRGSHVQGGSISGHSALSFSLATIVSFLAQKGIIIIMSYALAFLVAESRVEGGIHKFSDVVFGGLLGVFLTFLILKIVLFI